MIKLSSILSEDLRKWFGKGPTGGWDRYNTKGEKVGKCGDSEEGSKYAACLSNEKAAKLGKDGRASFVKRKQTAQSKAGDAKKGGEQKKGQKPVFVKTGASENINELTHNEKSIRDGNPNNVYYAFYKGQFEALYSAMGGVGLTDYYWDKFKVRKPAGAKFKLNPELIVIPKKEYDRNPNYYSKLKPHVDKLWDKLQTESVNEDWSQKYKNSIDCNNPKGFSQKAHCAGKNESMESKSTLEEKLNLFLEKNVPTDPQKWAASIAAAKKKFDVYPSAYANGWAAKNYKEKGGGWKTAK